MSKWVKKSQKGLAAKLSLHNFPTLIVRGEFDPLFSEINADALAQAQKNTDKVVIHAAGHLPHQENPEAFISAVCMWLSDQT
jgi:pimeloyl-ACP methyl ester carboxylesterase